MVAPSLLCCLPQPPRPAPRPTPQPETGLAPGAGAGLLCLSLGWVPRSQLCRTMLRAGCWGAAAERPQACRAVWVMEKPTTSANP